MPKIHLLTLLTCVSSLSVLFALNTFPRPTTVKTSFYSEPPRIDEIMLTGWPCNIRPGIDGIDSLIWEQQNKSAYIYNIFIGGLIFLSVAVTTELAVRKNSQRSTS